MKNLPPTTEMQKSVEILSELKCLLHEINRTFYRKSTLSKSSAIKTKLQVMWSIIHGYRLEHELSNNHPLNKIAGQTSKMRSMIMEGKELSTVAREFLVLRGLVQHFERDIVRRWYFLETGVIPSKIFSLSTAAKIIEKSEITVRRYLVANKIKGYKVAKNWWIPFEELQNTKRKGGKESEEI